MDASDIFKEKLFDLLVSYEIPHDKLNQLITKVVSLKDQEVGAILLKVNKAQAEPSY